jgi:hypothetical protein
MCVKCDWRLFYHSELPLACAADANSRKAVNFSSARTTKRFPVAAMRVGNEDCSPVAIHGGDAAPTPTGFAEIVSDDFTGTRGRICVSFARQTTIRDQTATQLRILYRDDCPAFFPVPLVTGFPPPG